MIGTSENMDTLGLKLIAEARTNRIVSVGIVDALSNAAYRFRGREESPLVYAPDWLIVPDKWTKDDYISLGYPEDKVIICGHPHYDHVLSVKKSLEKADRDTLRKCLCPGIACSQKVVTFLAEVSTGLNPEQYLSSKEYALTGRGFSKGRTQIVIEEFLDAVKYIDSSLYLVLRLHPKNTLDEFKQYIREFHIVSAGGSPLELMYASDLVVGMSTLSLFEAAILGCPTLSILPRIDEANWLPSIRMGLTSCVTSREKIRSEIKILLEQRINRSSCVFEQQLTLKSMNKIVNNIVEIINNSGKNNKKVT
jgi:hypothetical protein